MVSFQTRVTTKSVLRKSWLSFTKNRNHVFSILGKHTSPPLSQIAERWLIARQACAKLSTCSTYSAILSCHILPEFGARPVEEIALTDIYQMLNKKTSADADGALSATTVRGIVTVLRSLFSFAENEGFHVLNWESIHRPQSQQREIHILNGAEQQILYNYLMQNLCPEAIGVLICMYTGLRLGEICGMKWGDISFDADLIHVRRTVQRIRNPKRDFASDVPKTMLVFDTPKSKNSQRTIPIPGFLRSCLLMYRQKEDCFLLTGTEDFLEPRVMQNSFRHFLQAAGVEKHNFHALRHTFATNCINQGFDPKTLSEILGHSDVSVTLNTYVHPSFEKKRMMMDRLKEQ